MVNFYQNMDMPLDEIVQCFNTNLVGSFEKQPIALVQISITINISNKQINITHRIVMVQYTPFTFFMYRQGHSSVIQFRKRISDRFITYSV